MLNHIEKENLLNEENYSKVSNKMTEFNRKFINAFDKERRADLITLCKRVDSFTHPGKTKL